MVCLRKDAQARLARLKPCQFFLETGHARRKRVIYITQETTVNRLHVYIYMYTYINV